jgi:hypothetical protein
MSQEREQTVFTSEDNTIIDQWDHDLIEALKECPVTAEEAGIIDIDE